MNKGFTLIETLIAVAIFMVVGFAIYSSYSTVLDIVIRSRFRSTAISILENEIEMIRNIPYPDVGVQGGAPSGNLQSEKTVTIGSTVFVVKTTVRNIDDSFDGTLEGNPNDTVPADYKLVELEASCDCPGFTPVTMTTTAAPKNLEKPTKNGSLFINVFDASGAPFSGVNVSIVDNSLNPPININDVTNSSGSLNFVDIATSSAGYRITATKSGYSFDRTYLMGGAGNPNPTKPDAIVNEQELTKISFAVDRVSSLDFRTRDQMCKVVPNIDFQQTGEKLIGTNPDVFKYSVSGQTDVNGQKTVNNLEWDTYGFTNLDSDYDLAGSLPILPLVIDPNTAVTLTWLMEQKNPSTILVTVSDEDENAVNDASVQLVGPGFDQTKLSGRRDFFQTDWSNNQYTSKTDKVETDNPSGQLTIQQVNGKYATASQELISSTIDFGVSDTTFYALSWNPTAQPPQAGTDPLKFQIAANNDNATWNFVGPNGNSSSYYTVSGTQLHSSHNGKRYLRYKVFVKTDNDQFTPRLDDLTINFRSSCLPDGQTFFSGLASGDHTITVTKSGLESLTDTVSIISGWQEYDAVLFFP